MGQEPNTKRLITLLAVLFMSSLVLLSVSKSAPKAGEAATYRAIGGPELNAHAYLVKIIGDERPLIKRREWKKMAPASLTKLLTATVAREELAPTDWISFSEDSKWVGDKMSDVRAGEAFLRDDVLRLALISSANDAAVALAETVGKRRGGNTFEERLAIFRSLANTLAGRIGLKDSKFQNPTGLDDTEHFSTAEDLARLAEYIVSRHPQLWEISRTQEEVIFSDTAAMHRMLSTNELLKEFPAMVGGKTGFTDNAKGALLFLYPVRPNKTAVVVLLGSEDRFEDGRKIIKWLETISWNHR